MGRRLLKSSFKVITEDKILSPLKDLNSIQCFLIQRNLPSNDLIHNSLLFASCTT